MEGTTKIQVKRPTAEELNSRKGIGDSYDDVIQDLLDDE